jgi:alkylresorcinol/alkylpyrone synthase
VPRSHIAGIEPDELSAIFIIGDGHAAPSIDARLVNRMGLSPNIKRIQSGLGRRRRAAISRAADYVRGYPDQAAALLSIELCSLTLQRNDLSIAHLTPSALPSETARPPRWLLAQSASQARKFWLQIDFLPEHRTRMGWDIEKASIVPRRKC